VEEDGIAEQPDQAGQNLLQDGRLRDVLRAKAYVRLSAPAG
jgi:hypothetical protein